MKNKSLVAVFLSVLLILFPAALASQIYGFDYDSNGNLIQDQNKYYEYNSQNQLVKVRASDSNGLLLEEYFYDEEGNRIKKISYKETGVEATYYINENFVRVSDSSGTEDTVYVYHNGELIGVKDSTGKYYYHPDILGSTRLVTNENGEVVEKTSYFPFGELLEGGESRFLFTGQEKDKETGLMYYGARYYSPFLRRFSQPDTVLPDVYDPQQLNRYSYVRNNPLKYVDESGNNPLLVIGAAVTYVAAITSSYWLPYVSAYFADQNLNDIETAFENPTPLTIGFAMLATWDLVTPGIPEGQVGKGITKKHMKFMTKQKTLRVLAKT